LQAATTNVSPKKALELARKEKLNVENRVKYLANEQEKYQKKIEKARKDVERRNLIKAGKIDDLKLKIQAQKERHEDLALKSTLVRHEKNQTQTRKLKVAYEEMLVFEAERQREKLERSSI